MRNLKIIALLVSVVFLITACAQQPIAPEEPTSIEEPTTEEQTCTEMWLCQDENTKAYRKSDCTFEQTTNCPAGCENAECKTEEKTETELEEKPQETTSCEIGFKCLDENRRGYQSTTCLFSQVDECQYGCKDGKCVIGSPPPEEKEEFHLTEGKTTMSIIGRRYFDFSEEQMALKEVYDWDLKIKLYSKSSDSDYLRVESSGPDLWIIEKGITEDVRSDCINNIKDENSYHNLKSGQTLCIKTKERNIAMIGGSWEGLPDEYTELSWKYYVPKS